MGQLFKTTDEIRNYIAIDANMRFETVKPFVQEAEQIFIKSLLGDFYSVLLADYTDHTSAEGTDNGMNADNLELLPYVHRSLANYAGYLMVEGIGVTVGDSGIQQSFSQNSQPAPLWKVRGLQSSYISKGDRFADLLLEYLEQNATSTKYGSWFTDPDANTRMSGTIVYSTVIASRHIDINDSRRLYLRLKKRIKEVEATLVKKMICVDQYQAIIDELRAGNLSEANAALTDKLEPFIAKKSLYDTLPFLRIAITEDGITIRSTNDGMVSNAPATDNTAIGNTPYKNLLKSLEESIFSHEEEIKSFITENIADYPLIADSACYSATPISQKYVADNDPCNKHFSV